MEYNDIYGRVESFDQSVRSIDRRLRAVERRLSATRDELGRPVFEANETDSWTDPDIEELRNELQKLQVGLDNISNDLDVLKSNDFTHVSGAVDAQRHELEAAIGRIEELAGMQADLKEGTSATVDSLSSSYRLEVDELRAELEDARLRLQRQENMNRITIGSIKVPVELSGIVASVALITTGYLVWANRWDIIRSAYYPAGLAVLFAAAVIIKFMMTNRSSGEV